MHPAILPALGIALALALNPARAMRPAAGLCRSAISLTERTTGVPDRLMQAVAVMESGRREDDGTVAPWPWTINVEGVGEVYESKQEVIAAVRRHRAEGARSIDVGCMQVNLMHHADAFATLDEAFDPLANARYAARFLQQLLDQTGSWPRAIAGYHSLTPDIGADYARKVLAIWARPDLGRSAPAQPSFVPPAFAGPGPSSAMPSMPAPAPARMLAMPGAAGPGLTGRGLDSYRAMPTRLTATPLFRRS